MSLKQIFSFSEVDSQESALNIVQHYAEYQVLNVNQREFRGLISNHVNQLLRTNSKYHELPENCIYHLFQVKDTTLFYLAWYQKPNKKELEILKNICQCDLCLGKLSYFSLAYWFPEIWNVGCLKINYSLKVLKETRANLSTGSS